MTDTIKLGDLTVLMTRKAIKNVHLHLDRIVFSQHFRAQRKESGGDNSAKLNVCIVRCRKQISGQLFAQKFVVRPISIEGIDHIVAITPCVSKCEIFVQSIGVGITYNI